VTNAGDNNVIRNEKRQEVVNFCAVFVAILEKMTVCRFSDLGMEPAE
jgi:hypothetical protein